MPKVSPIDQRKSDHLRVNLEQDVRSAQTNGLERYRFVHQAVPEINLDEVQSGLTLFAKTLAAPILISSMTGGTREAGKINRRLAEAAQSTKIAMGVGSQRAALEHPEQIPTFAITRKVAPDILLFANLGAIQLNYGYTVDHCQRAVEMIEANALFLHLNVLQEAVQAGGNVNWKGIINQIEVICRKLSVPVVAKEVGWGISPRTAKLLAGAGVSAIDIAGSGGTSWSQVEMHRAPDEFHRRLAGTFIDWGIPTAESIINVRKAAPNLPIFASGGIRDGLDIAKCIALGATLVGMAGPFLKAASISTRAVEDLINLTVKQLQVTMFAAGVQDIKALRKVQLLER